MRIIIRICISFFLTSDVLLAQTGGAFSAFPGGTPDVYKGTSDNTKAFSSFPAVTPDVYKETIDTSQTDNVNTIISITTEPAIQ